MPIRRAGNRGNTSGSGIGTSQNNNNNNDDDDSDHNGDDLPIITHTLEVNEEEEEEDEDEDDDFVREQESDDDDGPAKKITGVWAKPDVQVLLKWLFAVENAKRYIKPGTTPGTKLIDVQKEVVEVVNAFIASQSEEEQREKKLKPWTRETVKAKFRYIKDQYDKCIKVRKKTINNDTDEQTLRDASDDICPYFRELSMIFGAQLARNHPPPRDSSDQTSFLANEPDLEERDVEKVMAEFTEAIRGDQSAGLDEGRRRLEQETKFQRDMIERQWMAIDRERQALDSEKEEWMQRKEEIKLDRKRLVDGLADLDRRNMDREDLIRKVAKYETILSGRAGSNSLF
ncbi:hypothetical protein DFQ27_004430 [Actinomortierella ambigua]|uniref:Uncharacterized protein n=1 Tax=Actinomortierella ambigua TaxID=1343610 RepID=A0A9P6Q3X2_9FUNG|nr:hypothetical protein DFQ27_004430 [Actinomortierella ambigua]